MLLVDVSHVMEMLLVGVWHALFHPQSESDNMGKNPFNWILYLITKRNAWATNQNLCCYIESIALAQLCKLTSYLSYSE